jgi:hypothetical protein
MFRFMYGKSPLSGKSPTPKPKTRGVRRVKSEKEESFYDFANRASPVNHPASRRVPMERTPTPFHSARSSTTPKQKRCPNGSRKNKKRICVKRGLRCPIGTRRNRKSRKCEPK